MNNPFLLNLEQQKDTNLGDAGFYIGTAADVSSSGVKILFDGQSEATEKRYKQINTGAALQAGDRIAVMKISGSYVVLGRISYENSGGGGGTVTVDDALSTTSENPVQNKVITNALNGKADGTTVLIPSESIAIPAQGSSVSKNMTGLTANHVLVAWNFSLSSENLPPVDLSWTTYNGYFTITNNSGTTSETIKPVFAVPVSVAVTNH